MARVTTSNGKNQSFGFEMKYPKPLKGAEKAVFTCGARLLGFFCETWLEYVRDGVESGCVRSNLTCEFGEVILGLPVSSRNLFELTRFLVQRFEEIF